MPEKFLQELGFFFSFFFYENFFLTIGIENNLYAKKKKIHGDFDVFFMKIKYWHKGLNIIFAKKYFS